MNRVLKGKIFGLPRWAFFILLALGVAVGLYLRRRSIADAGDQEGSDASAPMAEDPSAYADTLGGADGEAGLAGVGVASPPGGVYPVTTPIIPEGLTDVITDLTGVIGDIATAPADAVVQEPAMAPPPSTPTTGGGPPKSRSHAPVTVPHGARLSKTAHGRTRVVTGKGKSRRVTYVPAGTKVKKRPAKKRR